MKMVECPNCAGYGHDGVEEDTGALFACYRCGTTGRVPEASVHADNLAAYFAAERDIRAKVAWAAELGMDADDLMWDRGFNGDLRPLFDEYDGTPVRSRRKLLADAASSVEFDDIPF